MSNVTLNSHIHNSSVSSKYVQPMEPQELGRKVVKKPMDIKDIIAKMSGMSREEVMLPKEREELFEEKSTHKRKQNDREEGTSIYLYSNCSLQKQISKEYRILLSVV